MQICGIDDAGRGSMLGPLVIAGISLEKKKSEKINFTWCERFKKTLFKISWNSL